MAAQEAVVAGVDLGGTNTVIALADLDGNLQTEFAMRTDSHGGPERVLERIGSRIKEGVAELELPLVGVGMGVPGLVDVVRGRVLFLPNLPTQWRGVKAADQLRSRLGCPVRLMNDVRTATLGELTFGHGRDRQGATFAFFAIGTGIGGGVVVDGNLRLGPWGAAGELGHQTILPDGPRCGCGNRGCLETLASGPAIAAAGVRLLKSGMAPRLYELTGGDAGRVDAASMAAAAAEGDERVAEALEQIAGFIGIAVANTVVTLCPDFVVLGGGVAELGERLLQPVKRVLTERVGMFPTDSIEIRTSALGDRAGLWGALGLALQAI